MNESLDAKKTKSNKMNYILLGFFCFSFLSFLIAIFISRGQVFTYLFYRGGTDTFMDFFNSIRDAKDGSVYEVQKVIYPPLINICFYICSLFISKDLVYTTYENRYLMQTSLIGNIFIILFYVIVYASFIYLILKKFNGKRWVKILFIFLTLLSFPFIYAVERGNIILSTVLFTLIFLLYKDDENKVKRELSLIFLALAIATKLYPVIFSLLLLIKKDYKRFIRLAIYCFILIVIPFAFYGGIDGIITYIENIFLFSAMKDSSISLLNTNFHDFFFMIGLSNSIGKIIVTITVFIFLGLGFVFLKEDYKKVTCIVLMMVNFSANSSMYGLAFFLLPLFLLFRSEEEKSYKYVYLVCFLVLILPNGIYFKSNNAGYQLVYKILSFPCILILYITIILESFIELKTKFNKKIPISYASGVSLLLILSLVLYIIGPHKQKLSIGSPVLVSNTTNLDVSVSDNIITLDGNSRGYDIIFRFASDNTHLTLSKGKYSIYTPDANESNVIVILIDEFGEEYTENFEIDQMTNMEEIRILVLGKYKNFENYEIPIIITKIND